jgi:pyroglutamyl-peptidase
MSIRILATGFSVFPRAPVNPTEVLMGLLDEARPDLGPNTQLRTLVLPVEYARAPEVLAQFDADYRADVAVHFGLADTARGFRLESTARNRSSTAAPDAAGQLPSTARVCEGPATIPSTLPLDRIRAALAADGLPVQVSANAGAYLCNHIFYLSRSGRLGQFRPAMSGFIHVPFLDEQLAAIGTVRARRLVTLSRADMLRGAVAILRTCAASAACAGAQDETLR